MGKKVEVRFRRVKMKIFFCQLAFFLAALFSVFMPAQKASATKLKISLTKLAPVESTTLYGASDTYTMKIPIPDRWKIKSAVLKFSYVNSTALLKQNSRLVIWLNGRPQAQITLDPSSPSGKVRVPLSARLLQPGYNSLRFSVSQHYTTACEDPNAPELWTSLALDKSSMDFDYTLKPVPLSLSSVNFLFDPRIFSGNEVNLVTEDLSPGSLEAASIAAMGVAVRFDYRPVSFSISRELEPGLDNIVIGDKGFVSGIMNGPAPDKNFAASGPFIGILHMPGDGGHALIVLAGSKAGQLKEAARAFASMSFPLPESSSVEVKSVAVQPVSWPAGKGVLIPGREYLFKDIGFKTTVFKGMWSRAGSISVKLPDNVLLRSNSHIRLGLHLAYGAGMRKDSVLNVAVNGKFVAPIHLANQGGGQFSDYRIDVPADFFRPGENTVAFDPVLTPLVTGRCKYIQTGNLLLTLFSDSTIQIPSMTDWTAMPRIGLFTRDGFPFTGAAGMKNTLVYLPEKSGAAAAAAINLLSMAAQKAGFPGYNVGFTYKDPQVCGRDILAVGTLSDMPEGLLKAMPVRIAGKGLVRYPLIKNYEAGETVIDARLDSLIGKFLPRPAGWRKPLPYIPAVVNGVSQPEGRWALLAEFESPCKSGRSVVLLGASSPGALINAADAVLEPSIQGRASGALVMFDPDAPGRSIVSLPPSETYYVGRLGLLPRLNALIYEHGIIFLLLLLCCFGLLARLAYLKLKAFRAKRVRE